ncbi:site-specific integrase [Mesorhizobium sp. YIM 152430]|uniref:tyrosine-type recombinase/integrase n=1 Tax=Mesorhizobium sp. YIM 152430 TaxID=3031761 RepID=UPI0023DB4092|nr:site-specific integrase [Mesorhizobium sp. YIM 152430]MDF1600956.1 site-specific integrase [Mesorhizobium sp. YIM 152430]
MADIRKREGSKGVTYQVRYARPGTSSGYSYATFDTLKEARAFVESGATRYSDGVIDGSVKTVPQAIDRWLDICEKEGTDGNEPVTTFTLKSYRYFADYMKGYVWEKPLRELQAPDIVEFRSWLLGNCPSRYLARKTLTYFQTVMKEMALRGHIGSNPASGITVSTASRYEQPVCPPSFEEVQALLAAADRLANHRNRQVARAWRRNRPMIYLAADTGMRPGEYLALPRFNVSRTEVKVDRAIERNGDKISVTKTPAGWRWIDLSPDTADMVLHYADNHAPTNKYDLVFPTSTGRWQAVSNWRAQAFAAACFEAGLVEEVEVDGRKIERPKYSPYDLRHFYASMLIESRLNLKRIQQLMGHTNVTTTLNIYGHLIERAEVRSRDKIGLLARLDQNSCGESVAAE